MFRTLDNPTIKWTIQFCSKNSVCKLYLIILCPAYPTSSFAVVNSFHQYNSYTVARYQIITARCDILIWITKNTAVAMFIAIQISCDMKLYCWMNSSRSFEGPYCQHLWIKQYKEYLTAWPLKIKVPSKRRGPFTKRYSIISQRIWILIIIYKNTITFYWFFDIIYLNKFWNFQYKLRRLDYKFQTQLKVYITVHELISSLLFICWHFS